MLANDVNGESHIVSKYIVLRFVNRSSLESFPTFLKFRERIEALRSCELLEYTDCVPEHCNLSFHISTKHWMALLCLGGTPVRQYVPTTALKPRCQGAPLRSSWLLPDRLS